MHELAVTENVLSVVLRHAGEAHAARVTRIELVIGEMTGFVNDSIQFCFEALSPGTMAEGAELAFRRVPVRLRCHACAIEFEPEDMDWRCPTCAAYAGEVLAGREFYVDNIEIDEQTLGERIT
jgi:hydrogenase nickel incorporation protein HypA/HybF